MNVYLYVGQRMTSGKGKLVHAFVRQNENYEPGGEIVTTGCNDFTYWPKAKAHHFYGAQIGRLYEFDKLPDSWTASQVGEADSETVLELQTITKAEGLHKRETGLKVDPELQSLIAKLAQARSRVPYGQRLNFDVWVLNQLKN